MIHYLALDYGKNNLGLATSFGSSLATPLGSLKQPKSKKTLDKLGEIIKENQIEKIVIGLPDGELVPEIKKYGVLLESTYGKKVIFHPETLTTKEALRALRKIGVNRKKLQNEHTYASCLILEDYLESQQI